MNTYANKLTPGMNFIGPTMGESANKYQGVVESNTRRDNSLYYTIIYKTQDGTSKRGSFHKSQSFKTN